jgi:mannose-1-phosphate guanylyltransferase
MRASWAGLPALAAGDAAGFAAVTPAPVDIAVLERSKRPACCRTFRWDDIGSWDALLRIRTPDSHGNIAVGNVTIDDDVRRCVPWSESEHLAVSGISSDLVVGAPTTRW